MDGEEVGCDAVTVFVAGGRRGVVDVVREYHVVDDRADAVVDAEAGFVPGVEGEEDCIGGVLGDAFR